MATRSNFDSDAEYEAYLDGYGKGAWNERSYGTPPRTARSGHGFEWAMIMLMVLAVGAFGAWLAPDFLKPTATAPESAPAAPSGAIGRQAPPSAVRRAPAPQVSAPAQSVQQGIDQYNAAQEQQAQQFETNTAPLPLNSAGEPVIDQAQAEQQRLALQLAEQEAAAAVDQQLADMRAQANADALSRPPDVSKAEAEAMMGRDLCHVPRANPATCAQGLYKPTPVQ